MPNIDNQKSKKRLGRGLGSLLSTDMHDFEDQPQTKEKKTAYEGKKAHQQPVQKPVKASSSQASTSQAVPVTKKLNDSNSLDLKDRVLSLSIEKISPNSSQPRKDFEKEALEELALSIKEQGVLQPITVRKRGELFEIIAGERRWRASQLAGRKEIPALVREVDDQKAMELAMIENLQREDLNPIEEAMGYQLLIDDYDLTQGDLAQKVGKSRSAVANVLRLLMLPRDIKEMLRRDLIMFGHAKVLLGVSDSKKQISLARKCINKKLSVRALEKEVKKGADSEEASSGMAEMDVSERLAKGLAEDIQKILGTKVGIKYRDGKGKIEIAFYSDEELSEFCEQIKNKWKK